MTVPRILKPEEKKEAVCPKGAAEKKEEVKKAKEPALPEPEVIKRIRL